MCVCVFKSEAEKTWLQIVCRHFQMHILERKYIDFDLEFTEVCSQRST